MRPGDGSAREVVRHSGLASAAATLAVASGLVLDVAIAAEHGAGPTTDAFFVAARIPLGLVAIIVVGANQALVPSLSASLVRRGEDATWRLVSILLSVTLVGGLLLAALAAIVALPLVRVTAPGLDQAQADLAASLARVMFLVVPLTAAAEILRSLLNARHSFVVPAGVHAVLNVVAVALILASPSDIRIVAWAYVAGSVAQLAVALGAALAKGLRLRPSLAARDPEVAAAARHTVRPLVGATLNPIARVGEQLFVSFLPAGSITILNYGYRLISAIGGTVVFRSVIAVLLPRLARAAAEGRDQDVRSTTLLGVRIMLAISFPLTALVAVLGAPAADVFFRRGDFSAADAALLGLVLAAYSGSLIGSGVQRALLAPFYGRHDTRTPLRNTAYGVAANLALVPLAIAPFGDRPEAVVGVALAYSTAQYVNVGHAWSRLRRELDGRGAGIRLFVARLAAASAATAGVLLAVDGLASDALGGSSRAAALAGLVAATIAGSVAFGVSLKLLGVRELRLVGALIRGRGPYRADQPSDG